MSHISTCVIVCTEVAIEEEAVENLMCTQLPVRGVALVLKERGGKEAATDLRRQLSVQFLSSHPFMSSEKCFQPCLLILHLSAFPPKFISDLIN